MDDNRTMAQLLEAPTVGYEDAIVVPEITADNFELKHDLLTLVQNKQFFGHDKEDPHAHIRYFNKITSTMKFPNVPSTSQIKVRNSRNKPVVAKVSLRTSTPGISPDVAELKDMVKALLLEKKNQTQAPTPVKAVEESCVTCGGTHSYRNCPATDGNVYRDNIQESWSPGICLCGCQKPGHLAARLGCAETKVATWDDLAFKLIILGWNVKHRILQNVDPCIKQDIVPKDNVIIYSNPLFEFDDKYISSNVNPLFDEVLEDIKSEDSCVSKLDEPDLLVTPLFAFNKDECFDQGGDIDEIDAFLDIVVSIDIMDDYYESKGYIIYHESLLIKDTTLNLPPEVFLDHDPRSLKDKLDKEDLKSMVKVFDPGIHKKKFSPTYVSLPFEERHYLSFTYVIQIFLPYFTYPVDSFLPLSSGSEDIIFDLRISAFHFSSLEPVAYKSSMKVCSSTCFVLNITMI
ncbi:hypothetical protein Tco_0702556 [Tanacetum coccineum]|uniref:Reverse transcriptase domain-containing protein n=1 Tax=Tanacetum coccineum TaxID=301880 RepID=A0ABQ4XY45_9ASTR